MDWRSFAVLGDVWRSNAAAFGTKVALRSPAGDLSFDAINRRINRLNRALADLGLAHGERVAVLARNRREILEVCGVAKTGLIAMPLNWRLAARELQAPLAGGAPAAIIAEGGFAPVIDRIRTDLGAVRHFIALDGPRSGWLDYERLLERAAEDEPVSAVVPDDIACLMYTSGTTGAAKGAALTHRGLLANCRAAIASLTLAEDDVVLAVMPLFHVGSLWYHLFPALARGCTAVLMAEFDADAVVETIERQRVTNVQLVPTMIQRVLASPRLDGRELPALRTLHYAASSMPVALLRRAMERFPACGFVQGYGSTEAGMVAALTREDHARGAADPAASALLASCGRPLAGVEIRVRAPDGAACAVGEIGEISVRSPHRMAGYWRDPVATASAIAGGWLATGDLGRIDADGRLSIVDRKHDMIVSGGENVYPSEVESVLGDDPCVLEAAVFGVPDPEWVERVIAAVVPRPECAPHAGEILARARASLAGFKCPKEIRFVDELPKSAAGKVLRKELRRRYDALPADAA